MRMERLNGALELTWLGTVSGEDGCPSVFATNQGTYVVQGWRVTDPAALAELGRRGLPDHETAVEIPAELLRHLPSHHHCQRANAPDTSMSGEPLCEDLRTAGRGQRIRERAIGVCGTPATPA
jgi:hypothetical protein